MKNPSRGGDWPIAILLLAAFALVAPVLSKNNRLSEQSFLTLFTSNSKQVLQKPDHGGTQKLTLYGKGERVLAKSDSCIFVTIHNGNVSKSYWPGSTVVLKSGITKIHLTEVHDAGTIPYEAKLGKSYNVAVTVVQ